MKDSIDAGIPHEEGVRRAAESATEDEYGLRRTSNGSLVALLRVLILEGSFVALPRALKLDGSRAALPRALPRALKLDTSSDPSSDTDNPPSQLNNFPGAEEFSLGVQRVHRNTPGAC